MKLAIETLRRTVEAGIDLNARRGLLVEALRSLEEAVNRVLDGWAS